MQVLNPMDRSDALLEDRSLAIPSRPTPKHSVVRDLVRDLVSYARVDTWKQQKRNVVPKLVSLHRLTRTQKLQSQSFLCHNLRLS